MVIAKNETAFGKLKQQFIEHTIIKKYIALVGGIVVEDSFTIDAPLGRNKKEYKQSVNPTNPRGALRDAVTEVKVIERRENTTLVELTPKTGRTHQLRAHMSYIGHPIVGDVTYGSATKDSRIMLHAKTLSFFLNNESVSFDTDIPKEFH
jgi:23S rRNA pseudouridine1911/1915/1917 synthase